MFYGKDRSGDFDGKIRNLHGPQSGLTEEKLQSPTLRAAWAPCAQLPCKQFSNPLLLNENEIVVSPYGKNEYLRKYNIAQDRFDSYIPYPTEVQIKFHTIALDKDSGKIFLYDGSDRIFVTFDLQKQMVTKCRKKKQSIVGNGKYSTSLVLCHQSI